jgi:RNA polymerase sigma-32 factor
LLIEDLVGEGSIGLLEALKKFDLSRNMRFITYAAHWIRARMGEFVRIKKDGFTGGMGTGKVRYQAFYGFNAKREKLEMQGVPSEKIMGILAKEFGTTEERLTASVQRHAVYSMPYEDAGIPMFDKHPNAEELLGDFEHAVVVKSKVTKSLRKLDARQRKVVHDRIMNDETVTLDTLGSIFQVSRERVRQIEVKALDKLRNLLAEHAA